MSDTALRTFLRTELAALKEKGLYKAERQIATPQRGKFITVYTEDASHAQRVLNAINPELQQLRDFGGIGPGPAPTTRESGHRETEIPAGGTGLVWTRWYEEGDQD